ncbi:MAG: peptidoglycan-binding domain-containing protein [Pseudomonadota bacterium]
MMPFMRWRQTIALAFMLFAGPLWAQNDPNDLVNEAISTYAQATAASGDQRYQLFRQVDDLLTRIETEHPGSGPASLMQLGSPLGPIDPKVLETELAVGPSQLAGRLPDDLAAYWEILRERSPEVAASVETTLTEAQGATIDAVKDELYVKASYYIMAAFYYTSDTAFGQFFDPEEAGQLYRVFVGAGRLENLGKIGASTVEGIAVDVALDFASSTIADFAVRNGPEMSASAETLVHAAIKATITEVILAFQASKDPTKVPGLLLKRVTELIEIITTTRGLAADVDRALAQTALRMQTMAQLTVAYRDQERVQTIITSTRKSLAGEMEGAVGKDDAKAVSDIMLLGWAALTAEFEGEPDQAKALHDLIVLRGGVKNMPTIWNAPDLLTYFANGFTDSPKRAAEIMIGLTELSKYAKPPEVMEAITTPSTSSDLANTQIAPDGFLPPTLGSDLNALSLKAAQERFLGSFAEICALPSVKESGLACPVIENTCEGAGCVSRGPMQALETVELFAAPNDPRRVTTMQSGDWGFNELVRTWYAPCKSIVSIADDSTADGPALGTVLWRLKEGNEGYSKFHWPGRGEIDFIGSYTENRSEARSSALDPCLTENRAQWALITTKDGQRGWYEPKRQFSGSNSIDINAPLSGIPQWLEDYADTKPDHSNTENPFALVFENAFEDAGTVVPDAPSQTAKGIASPSGWSLSPQATPLEAGVPAPEAELSTSGAVSVFGRQVLPKLASASTPDTTVGTALRGTYREVFQTVPSAGGWQERMALVPRDPSKPTFAITPEDVFRFSRKVAWSEDGRFAVVQYNFSEFASDGLLVDLSSGAFARIKSDRNDVLHSNIALPSLKDLGNGLHSVVFSHFRCPQQDPNCGMANVEDAGITTVKFKVPEAPVPQAAPATVSQVDLFDALPDGTYGIDADTCARQNENFGEKVYSYFRHLYRPDFGDRYDQSCSIVSKSESEGILKVNLECNMEGTLYSSTVRLRVNGPESFTDLNALGGPKNFQLCETQPDRVKATQDNWTDAIVIASDAITFDCFSNPTPDCLRAQGAPEETIRFVQARETTGGSGAVMPVDFKELGVVDIAYLQFSNAAGTIYPYLVNTSPDSIVLPLYPERELKTYGGRGDRIAQAVLRQYPDAFGWNPQIIGMRKLPSGHQRFSLVVPYTEFCRACPYVAYAVTTVDYDQTGRLRAVEGHGIFDARRLKHKWHTKFNASDAAQMPSLVQYLLNTRGYAAGAMDGAIGPKTKAALAAFQKENNIGPASGQLDRRTLAALVDQTTLFSNGLEAASTSPQQAEIGKAPLPGCARPGRALTTAEAIKLFSGAKITESFSEFANKTTRYSEIPAEGAWVKQFGEVAGQEVQYREPVRISNGKLCTLVQGDEFCDAINICNSPDAAYVLTPFGGTPRYILNTAQTAGEPASCSSPASLLSKREILSSLAGKSADTRPGNNRYALQTFSDYDLINDRGTVTIADDRGRFDQIYVVRDGELCTQNPSGGPRYCDQVRRCDYDGTGPKIGFFNGDQLSTPISLPDTQTDSSDPAPTSGGFELEQKPLTTADYERLFAQADGEAFMRRLVSSTRWEDTPDQRASLILMVKAVISGDADYTPTRKASILLSVMHEAAMLAGGDGELFRTMNYARNTQNGTHPTIEQILAVGSQWKEAKDSAKEFHRIGYDSPDDVRKFTHPDGREAVFARAPNSGQWVKMQDGTNDATYNLVNGSVTDRNDFYQHMLLDVVPWIVYGVSPEDQTSFTDRLTAFEKSGPLATATKLYPYFTKTSAELTVEILDKLPASSQMTGPMQAWLLHSKQ